MAHNVIIITIITIIDWQNEKFKPYYAIITYLLFECQYFLKMQMNFASFLYVIFFDLNFFFIYKFKLKYF